MAASLLMILPNPSISMCIPVQRAFVGFPSFWLSFSFLANSFLASQVKKKKKKKLPRKMIGKDHLLNYSYTKQRTKVKK